MKSTTILLLWAISMIISFGCNAPSADTAQTVNPLIGDVSFVETFGYKPGATTSEDLRIKTHLIYVENLLRTKDVASISPQLKAKRTRLLDLLHDYATTGIFPRNYDYTDQRQPCFIDKDNRICAVGYLIEKSAGRPVAEEINTKHKYDRLLAMNDEVVDGWIESSGLSKQECAMIQPTYGPRPSVSYNYIPPAYGISSSVLSGVNLSLSALNRVQQVRGGGSKAIAIAGLITGAGQTIVGVANFPKTTNGFYGNTTNESKKTLSMINIGLGTTTMILSTWSLLTNKKLKDKRTTYNLNSFETFDNNIGMAFTLTRRF